MIFTCPASDSMCHFYRPLTSSVITQSTGSKMPEQQVNNLNVLAQDVLTTPEALKNAVPLTEAAERTVIEGRQTIQNILDGNDPRLLVVVGPCSIHDVEAALDYARRLRELADQVSDSLYIVMRVYFEKPRTTVGWKGLINDPHLNDSFEIDEGLHIARKLLVDLAEMGLPLATEALDPISPQYLQDCISWSAIGARTTESQTHREMASGLSCPVGFKNGTDGSLDVAINALQSVASPHNFLGINQAGQVAIIRTRGNAYGHVVLRGGNGKPNYDSVSVALAEKELEKAKLSPNIMIDCSHANSNKDAALQPLVLENVTNQILEGNTSIIGLMVESNIGWGNQKLTQDLSQLQYGVSITDACIDWDTTVETFSRMNDKLAAALAKRIVK
ncbi:DHAP synthase, class 1 [Vreelandella titanicae BH1]|uniref:Phospho-2-dehydro-3-deoxyheptonate aldolase n=2 Tax=Oceanospirillales TaxID=135619 RepID=L9UB10_9GAMM|nr:DHAP synthase, class 1 [Halomonas titanicae BH1]